MEEEHQKRMNRVDSKKKEYMEKIKNRQQSKRESSLWYAIKEVKEHARQDTWCSAHANCFRCTIGKCETDAHIRAKFERFLFWRRYGATVFSEVKWKGKGGRSDLVVCLTTGEIFIEEIVVSEKEKSLLLKEDKYPFEIRVINANV